MGNMYHLEKLKFNFLLSDFLECLFSKALCRVVFFYFYSQLSLKKKKWGEEQAQLHILWVQQRGLFVSISIDELTVLILASTNAE